MNTSLFAGAALGLSVAAPFGPVSLVCVQQSLALGLRHGVMTGCGAATAHGIFAAIAIASAGIASAILTPAAGAIRLFSALILIGLGIRALRRARPVSIPVHAIKVGTSYASALMLSLSNPMTIIPYLALATAESAGQAAALSLWSVPGVVIAALTWYVVLSVVTSALRRGLSAEVTRILNLMGGCFMIAFGASVGREILLGLSHTP